MSHNLSRDHCSHDHHGTCGGIENLEWVETKIDRRKLRLSPKEFEEKAREHARIEREESGDGRLGRRSFMGKAAGVATAGLVAPASVSATEYTCPQTYGPGDPISTTTDLNIRDVPSVNGSIIKVAEGGTGMIVEDGPFESDFDSYCWWRVRVNGCSNNTSRVTGYCVEHWTAPSNFAYGTWGTVTSIWGDDRDFGYHRGIDIANDTGTPIFASRQGTVTFAGWASGYGNVIYIDHGSGFETRYAHLSDFHVSEGQWVDAGQRIGDMGCTGTCDGPHLHFEIRVDGADQNWPQVRYAEKWLNSGVPRDWGLGSVHPDYPY